MNRRRFVQFSAAATVAAAARGLRATPKTEVDDGGVRVKGAQYTWEYTRNDDRFRLRDHAGRTVVEATMQPAVVTAPGGQPQARVCKPGKPLRPVVKDGAVTIAYEQVNGASTLTLTWTFDENGIWLKPVVYRAAADEDVVSLHWFAGGEDAPAPTLHANSLTVPGVVSGPAVSPVLGENVHLNESVWLGRGSFIPGLNQQWGLPVHYFAGFNVDASGGQREMLTSHRSEAFCCGLADLPAGDLFLEMQQGMAAPWVDYRSDLWHHRRGPGELKLGATLLFVVAENTYEAIGAYYEALVRAGIVQRKQWTAGQARTALTPEFCTWGAQVERHREGGRLDEKFLEDVYGELKSSGMRAGLYSIDDKWEGTYGNLEHDEKRFPHLEDFLKRLRGEGMRVGMWAALMRCERPQDLGLTVDQMLQRADGTAYRQDFSGSHYYILDFTRPEVARVLEQLARRFMRRYRPDLLKFDFGYELPAVREAMPADKNWAGERLMLKGLETVIPAMRAENPDLVVMYYNLSPLLVEHFDLHSPDDLYQAAGEYEVEANRRYWFSSLLGRLGVPTYGSSGYDWASAPEIWFDSVAQGTIGSLNDFAGDEQGLTATPERIARYNGLAECVRLTTRFETVPVGTVDGTATRGVQARTWARFEEGELVLLARRPPETAMLNPLGLRGIEREGARGRRIQAAVEAPMPVVVSARGAAGLETARELALVPCGAGTVMVRREQGAQATVRHRFLGGAVEEETARIEGGRLRVVVRERNAAGAPLEWIEVRVS